MKKIFSLLLLLSAIATLTNCTSSKEWSQEQRAEFVTMLDPYRQMVYLREFNDDEFTFFTNDMSSTAEVNYPAYRQLVAMPSLNDTLDVWVVATIVEDLDTDAANMRYLYPYHQLVNQGILPEGLDHQARIDFYRCFAQKVNNHFSSLESFFYAVITNSIEPNLISTMQGECAAELFNFTMEIVEIES